MAENPIAIICNDISDESVGRILSDLNFFYICQIVTSLKKHVDLQDRLDREIKIRDGATRLIAACTHENQLLEAAKTLLTSNARTFSYMNELQKLKAAEVMDAVMSNHELTGDFSICKGRVALSDIRIPLLWKDYFVTNKAKDQSRHAVFCLVTVNSEVQDSELVCIDRATTDISFDDVVVFENVSHDSKILVEIFAHPMSATASGVSAATPQKLLSRLNRSNCKEAAKRGSNRTKVQYSKNKGPQYEKLAKLVLTLDDIDHVARSHDIEKLNDVTIALPLYDSIICRLAAQPKCLTEVALSGFLNHLEMISSAPSWTYLWCELKAGFLRGWKNPEDSSTKDAHICIDVLAKDIKTNQIERARQKRSHSFQIRDYVDRYIFAADNKNELNKWIKGIRQHRTDYCAWGSACETKENEREPMFIASPRAKVDDLLYNSAVRKTLVYEQLSLDSPTRALSEVIRNKDLLEATSTSDTSSVPALAKSLLVESEAPWASFFTGGLASATPAKVTCVSHARQNSSKLRHDGGKNNQTKCSKEVARRDEEPPVARNNNNDTFNDLTTEQQVSADADLVCKKELCSEASGSDDAFLSESEEGYLDSESRKKKKRLAPQPPKTPIHEEMKPALPEKKRDHQPPAKPPLPRLPANFIKSRRMAQTSVSSASSLDDILEEGKKCGGGSSATLPSHRSSLRKKSTPIVHGGGGGGSNHISASISLHKSSGGSKKLNNKPPRPSPAMVPLTKEARDAALKYHQFARSQSVDYAGVDSRHNMMSRMRACSTSSVVIPQQQSANTYRPAAAAGSPTKQPLPTPRRSYLHAVESAQREDSSPRNQQQQQQQNAFTFRQLSKAAGPSSPPNTYKQQQSIIPPALPHLPQPNDQLSPPKQQPKLPPKERKSSTTSSVVAPRLPPKKHRSSSGSKSKEPLYARVDIEKKRSDRARKASLASINEVSNLSPTIIVGSTTQQRQQQQRQAIIEIGRNGKKRLEAEDFGSPV